MNSITNTYAGVTHTVVFTTNFDKEHQTTPNSMQPSADSDNIYKVGTIAYAKSNPNRMLLIKSYKQRIYYCSVVGQPTHKLLSYFEAELIQPVI